MRGQATHRSTGTCARAWQGGSTATHGAIASPTGQQHAAHSAIPAAQGRPRHQGADGGQAGGGDEGVDPPGGSPTAAAQVALAGGESGGGGMARVGEKDSAVLKRGAPRRAGYQPGAGNGNKARGSRWRAGQGEVSRGAGAGAGRRSVAMGDGGKPAPGGDEARGTERRDKKLKQWNCCVLCACRV